MFLCILAYHSNDHVISFMLKRSYEAISRYFYLVLNAILQMQETLLRAQDHVPEDGLDEK